MIPIWTRISIFFVARRDSRNLYGKYLMEIPSKPDLYLPSVFMEDIVDKYAHDSQVIITCNKSAYRIYTRIVQRYEALCRMDEYISVEHEQLHAQLTQLQEKHKNDRSLLEELTGYWNEANQTGIVSPKSGATSLFSLKKRIDQTQAQLNDAEQAIKNLEKELTVFNKVHRGNISKAQKNLRRQIKAFRRRIGKLHRKTQQLIGNCDSRLNYYWSSLIKRLNGYPIRQMSFSEICKLRDVQIIQENDIFQKERAIINATMKEHAGFEIDV